MKRFGFLCSVPPKPLRLENSSCRQTDGFAFPLGQKVSERIRRCHIVLANSQEPERSEIFIRRRPKSVMQMRHRICVINHRFDLLRLQGLRPFAHKAIGESVEVIAGDLDILALPKQADMETVDIGIKTNLQQAEVLLQLRLQLKPVIHFGEILFHGAQHRWWLIFFRAEEKAQSPSAVAPRDNTRHRNRKNEADQDRADPEEKVGGNEPPHHAPNDAQQADRTKREKDFHPVDATGHFAPLCDPVHTLSKQRVDDKAGMEDHQNGGHQSEDDGVQHTAEGREEPLFKGFKHPARQLLIQQNDGLR